MKNNLLKTHLSVITLAILGSYTSNAHSETLAPVTVYGETATLDGYKTDEQNYDAIYDNNYSTDFVGKKRIDTYRGTTPSDLLNSFAGVFSGEARSSGAIGPNIRGLQGEGRVTTRIDGTEQEISAYRGYNGTGNRNYIDPMLTSSIRIVKDSGLDTGVATGIGGGIQIKTIDINDISDKERGFVGDVRLEIGSNSVKPRIAKDYDGMKAKDVPFMHDEQGNLIDYGVNNYTQYSDFMVDRKYKNKSDELNLFKGQDYAGRIALGYKEKNWDILGAVAIRERGNYFSGKNGARYYDNPKEADTNPVRSLAYYFKPGGEVFNSSQKTTSYLFKTSWQPSESQKIKLNIRRTESANGEIMPSWVMGGDKDLQIPLSTVEANAYSLQYYLNPKENKWLNLKANIWQTDTFTDGYNSGGDLVSGKSPIQPDDEIMNSAHIKVKHIRRGLDLSNTFNINDNVNITLLGRLQQEKMNSDIPQVGKIPSWAQMPRNGRRQEYSAGFNTHWQATDKLSFDVGANYSSYWMFDDSLDDYLKTGIVSGVKIKDGLFDNDEPEYKYDRLPSEEEVNNFKKTPAYQNAASDRLARIERFWKKKDKGRIFKIMLKKEMKKLGLPVDFSELGKKKLITATQKNAGKLVLDEFKNKGISEELLWKRDANGKFTRENNPCFNGTIKNIKGIVTEGYEEGQCPAKRKFNYETVGKAEAKKMTGHNWVPSLAVNYKISDYSKVYARYNESVRYPSTTEGLVSFANLNPAYTQRLRPEHSRKFELGYVHNLTPYFSNVEIADIKLAYYQNNIKDVIDRDYDRRITNLEEQKMSGIELQARYDNGKFFGDIGIHYLINNQVCDSERAVRDEDHVKNGMLGMVGRDSVPRCVRDGFYDSYSLTRATPKLSAKLHLGGRFLENKLELGSRLTYFKKVDLDNYNYYLWTIGKDEYSPSYGINPVYGWDNTFLVDAYVRYKLNKNYTFELSGNNLTDQYYVDPSSRTATPAPGRNVKLSFTGRF